MTNGSLLTANSLPELRRVLRVRVVVILFFFHGAAAAATLARPSGGQLGLLLRLVAAASVAAARGAAVGGTGAARQHLIREADAGAGRGTGGGHRRHRLDRLRLGGPAAGDHLYWYQLLAGLDRRGDGGQLVFLLRRGRGGRGADGGDLLRCRLRRAEDRRLLRLDRLALGGALHHRLGLDVDTPAGELGGEAGVLALLADRQGELLIGHHHRRRVRLLVRLDADHARRAKRMRDEAVGVGVPLDHVDALAAELVDHILDADAAQADAGADGVHALFARVDGDLAAEARLASDRLDLDRAAVDLGDLQLEQTLDQIAVRAGDDHLRALDRLVHAHDQHLDALGGAVVLDAHLLAAGQQRLGLAQVEDGVAALQALDHAGDDVALLAGVLVVDRLALRLAQLLEHDLLRRLRLDAPGVLDLDLLGHRLAEARVRLDLARVLERQLLVGVLHLLDHIPV